MSDQRDGGIAWCDQTWNPIRGCSRVNASCTACYAEGVAIRFSKPGLAYYGLVRISAKTGKPMGWNGQVRVIEDHMFDPLGWKRPRRIFVNSMSDLWHDALDEKDIVRIFAVMGLASHHTFMTLTKRPERQQRVLSDRAFWSAVKAEIVMLVRDRKIKTGVPEWVWSLEVTGALRNLWVGASVGNQEEADEFLPWLCRTPTFVRWASYEPAHGPIDFHHIQMPDEKPGHTFSALKEHHDDCVGRNAGPLHLVVVGGESSRPKSKARPFMIEWARDTIRQCREADVAVFVKQLGSRPQSQWSPLDEPDDLELVHPRGEDPEEWPAEFRVREMPT